MATKTTIVIGVLFLFTTSCSGQYLATKDISQPVGICPGFYCNSIKTLQRLKGCVTILGNLRILLMEKTNSSAFQGISFPELREVTDFVVLYRVVGLETLGQLFPNLTRIRGAQLINNYALVVHDMPNLRDVGLFSLLKIDRGGVIIWGGPHTCYVDTIDWSAIAPSSRHMLTYPEMTAHCNTIKPCKCKKQHNFCWSSKKCQRFDTGQESCSPECLGCVPGRPDECSVCRHYTYQGRCVSQCPPHTILLPDNQYCITVDECNALNGWSWRNNCIFECPIDYVKTEDNGEISCSPCFSCQKICPSLTIDSLSSIQQAERCVYVNGHLIVHVRSVPGAVEELKKYLKRIEVVTDYVLIYGSLNITNLYFLPSLRLIAGRNLEKSTYSLIISDMRTLQETFLPTMLEKLQIDRGKLKVINNPMLCMNKINELKKKFKVQSNDTDIPPGLNGYSGDCEKALNFRVKILNQTAAEISFTPLNNSFVQYTVLYAKVPSETRSFLEPEICSDSEWYSIHADSTQRTVVLKSLNPASTYAVCIETFTYSTDNFLTYLSRTKIINVVMPFDKPKPPFIQEVVAISPYVVRMHWVDHKDYRRHIISYILDISLVEIHSKDLELRDHCDFNYVYYTKEDYSRHLTVLKPPTEYESCEGSCIALTSVAGDMIEDNFDVCDSIESDCDQFEETSLKNSSFKGYVKTLSLVINSPKTDFRVEGLAPYRDYRLRLRSCSKEKCSRSTSGVVRTLPSKKADIPYLTDLNLNETGHISVKWKPPDETNGPILAYFVQVLPGDASNETLPYIWCLYPNEQSLIVKSQVSKELLVRVCSSTLGSYKACTEWKQISIPVHNHSFIFGAIFFSIILIFISVFVGFFYQRRKRCIDGQDQCLVDMTSVYRNESDSPVVLLADFMPLYEYSMPLSKDLLD